MISMQSSCNEFINLDINPESKNSNGSHGPRDWEATLWGRSRPFDRDHQRSPGHAQRALLNMRNTVLASHALIFIIFVLALSNLAPTGISLLAFCSVHNSLNYTIHGPPCHIMRGT